MKINICLPHNGAARAFRYDLTHPVCVANSWERIVCDSQALYEKELASLVGLNLLCSAIRNFAYFDSLDKDDVFHISSVLKLFCRYIRNFTYGERYE